jgi:hypothetical protein
MPNDIFVPVDDILKHIDSTMLATSSLLDDYEAARRQYEALKDANTAKPTRQRRERKPTLASVAKQASKAGIEVARYEVESGKITIVTGKPGEANGGTVNEWDEVFNGDDQASIR